MSFPDKHHSAPHRNEPETPTLADLFTHAESTGQSGAHDGERAWSPLLSSPATGLIISLDRRPWHGRKPMMAARQNAAGKSSPGRRFVAGGAEELAALRSLPGHD